MISITNDHKMVLILQQLLLIDVKYTCYLEFSFVLCISLILLKYLFRQIVKCKYSSEFLWRAFSSMYIEKLCVRRQALYIWSHYIPPILCDINYLYIFFFRNVPFVIYISGCSREQYMDPLAILPRDLLILFYHNRRIYIWSHICTVDDNNIRWKYTKRSIEIYMLIKNLCDTV